MNPSRGRLILSWIVGIILFGILHYLFEEAASSLGFKTSFYFEGFEYDQYVETDKSTSLGWFLILIEIVVASRIGMAINYGNFKDGTGEHTNLLLVVITICVGTYALIDTAIWELFDREIKRNVSPLLYNIMDLGVMVGIGYLGYIFYQNKKFSKEKIPNLKTNNKIVKKAIDLWNYEIDHKYGSLLPESEIMENDDFLYFYQTNRKRLCAAWDKKNKIWQVNVDRSLLEGLSFSTPKRFEKIVFGEKTEQKNCYLKQYLIEYLLYGLDVGEIKTLTKDVDNGAKIEFSLEAKTWNEMLIGNLVGVEGGMCKYFEKNTQEERILHFAMLCKSWDVNIEFILDEYENYEQYNFSIKEFGGYYN